MLFWIEHQSRVCETKSEFIGAAEGIVGSRTPVYVQALSRDYIRVWKTDYETARHSAYKARKFSKKEGHPERRDEVFTSVKAAADYIFQ